MFPKKSYQDIVLLEGLAEDELVVAAAEGVGVHGHRREVGVRVLALGLARRGAVVVPDGKLCNGRCPSYLCIGDELKAS